MILNSDQFWWWTRVTKEHTGLKTLKLLKAKLASHPFLHKRTAQPAKRSLRHQTMIYGRKTGSVM